MQADLASELNKLQKIKEEPHDSLNDVFDLLDDGCNGGVKVIPRSIPGRNQGHRLTEQLSKLPNGLLPIFPSNHDLELEEYLLHPEKLPIHNFYESQTFWSRTQKPESLFNTTFSPVLTDLKVKRDPKTGKLLGYHEVALSNADSTGRNSTSLLRHPEPQTSDIRGNSTNIPFKPGGLDQVDTDSNARPMDVSSLDFEKDLCDIPPGFTQRVSFKSDAVDGSQQKNVISIADILTGKVDFDDDFEQKDEKDVENEVEETSKVPSMDGGASTELKKSGSLENLLPKEEDITDVKLAKSDSIDNEGDQDWAVIVTDPVKDFHSRVPEMARTYKFELDTFQKQAVIHLENKECVFVAAHTSAGKTVVAEYAIALSERNMTKTIYTSPIKALSNQKFREFKDRFESVGLITGDMQINADANCLVMTTEILRSMLYRGSRLIRDTEWVIFDEVHYVNDAERGVVWEEVLIMLPEHVGIIMLSATVPNTKEFAGWVGRIKKKKIYVISTLKRPVPLVYYLYTGNSAKTANEMFPIVDRKGKFLPEGHRKAVEAKKERSQKYKAKDNYGAKGPRSHTNPNEERNVWISLIRKLEKDEGLPVVAFTFSRNRCNDNAGRLSNMDLTTSKEKHEIHIFMQKCISRLKDQDKQLPQVKKMQELLKRGLAVHHSGILPILKEMIEMLFQDGYVKVLFATETFAMGVNMPARTVVFDSIRKHDGEKFRDLLPGEFIQMAGRAGRRGLDDTGTVIMLCKADVPEISAIEKMMMGKPALLESRFRLTYSMILNLLRSDELCVEDMMKRSFAEFHLLRKAPERKTMILKCEEELKQLETLDCEKCTSDVGEYFDVCKRLKNLTHSLQIATVSSPSGQKLLSNGRIIIISTKQFSTRYAMILNKKSQFSSLESKNETKTYTVLIACDQNELILSEEKGNKVGDKSEVIVEPYTDTNEIHCPQRPCAHMIIEISEGDIVVITERIKQNLNGEAMINDFNKRQQPRFRNDLPGKSISSAIEELMNLSETFPKGLPMMNIVVKDLTLHEQKTERKKLESEIHGFECVACPSFKDHFRKYTKRRVLLDEIKGLEAKSSIEMLSHIDEYRHRKEVLKELGYLSFNEVVDMKGRVACEISNHEVLISLLLYNNFFNGFEPAEVVALLSCFVFEQKKCGEPKLTEKLKKGKETILQTATKIATVEKKCGMDTSCEEFLQQFKFGLVEVVYEWARGMPFNEITDLTDVQEGIIVRCIQRLNDLCSDVKNASRCLGVKDVELKMEIASTLLKRDIVFAASLYTE
ncbi:helicase SKI2W-like [Dendronephthya gigantea]|uniref:helicase SKI2W-like n=1 Tax=Dendronephthya gigantea TaxID=151771 RepID=UPI00106CE29E|nr:helicase SKI2W-like [Dendronephthya gigantea]